MPYEDYTAATEADASGRFNVDSATKITYTAVVRNETGHFIYWDKTAGHFSGDFTHLVENYLDVTHRYCAVIAWAISNNVDDYQSHIDDSLDGVFLQNAAPTVTGNQFIWKVVEDGNLTQDFTGTIAYQTLYFLTLDRDDDGGANSTGRYTCYVRTGSHEGDLVDTLVVDSAVGEQNDYRYLYAVAESADYTNAEGFGYVQNLDLQEAAPASHTWTGTGDCNFSGSVSASASFIWTDITIKGVDGMTGKPIYIKGSYR